LTRYLHGSTRSPGARRRMRMITERVRMVSGRSKQETLILARQQYGDALERIRAAGVVQDHSRHGTSPEDTNG
jgi:hypothetical protein